MNTITPIRSVRALRELADYLEGLPEDDDRILLIVEEWLYDEPKP